MNKRDQAVCDWVDKNRPDLSRTIRGLLKDEAIGCAMSIAFEAGRQFQSDNPGAELNNPNIYMR